MMNLSIYIKQWSISNQKRLNQHINFRTNQNKLKSEQHIKILRNIYMEKTSLNTLQTPTVMLTHTTENIKKYIFEKL